jgi:hypothetical protein
MKFLPRHIKILTSIEHFGSCCENLLIQVSGVTRIEQPLIELKKEGLIKWTNRSRFGKYNRYRPPGWTLTEKGKIYTKWIRILM